MTEDQTSPRDGQRAGFELPLPGLKAGGEYEEAQEHETDPDADFGANELHAPGQTCARCGRAIGPDDDARRTASGAYEHEFCEIRADPAPPVTGG